MITKRTYLLLGSLLSSAIVFPLVGNSDSAQALSIDIDTVLSGYQLQRVSCKSGNYVVISVGNKQYCAFPNSQYPAGIYRLNPETYELHSVGGNPSQSPVVMPPPPPTGSVVMPQTYPPYGTGGPIVNSPAIIDNYNQYATVPPAHEVHIRGMLAKRGISLASCNQTPVTIFTIGRYTACAYPTPSYPAGRYQVDATLPF